jgi:hypothetical protein
MIHHNIKYVLSLSCQKREKPNNLASYSQKCTVRSTSVDYSSVHYLMDEKNDRSKIIIFALFLKSDHRLGPACLPAD